MRRIIDGSQADDSRSRGGEKIFPESRALRNADSRQFLLTARCKLSPVAMATSVCASPAGHWSVSELRNATLLGAREACGTAYQPMRGGTHGSG
jgi:hypothetical protein